MWGMFSKEPKIEDTLFNITMTAKQLEKMSSKEEKRGDVAKKRMVDALKKGNKGAAAIHAQTVISNRSQANNYLRMSARLEGVKSKIQGALTMQEVAKDLGKVCKGMDKAMASMDMTAMMTIMDDFEKMDEDITVQTEVITGGLGSTTAAAVSSDDVSALLREMESEVAMEGTAALPDQGVRAPVPEKVGVTGVMQQEEDDMQSRLAALRAI
eukprot:m.28215 g.28215  ORF g.28215 m.28215 type:complete len:212 (-) comp12002_c0_seq1:317-952(-)